MGRLIDKIKNSLPQGKRLIEPFVGSGAVFLNTNYSEYLCVDKNADLINLFKIVQKDGIDFIQYAKQFFKHNTEEDFYKLREEFNQSKDIYKKSALFILRAVKPRPSGRRYKAHRKKTLCFFGIISQKLPNDS